MNKNSLTDDYNEARHFSTESIEVRMNNIRTCIAKMTPIQLKARLNESDAEVLSLKQSISDKRDRISDLNSRLDELTARATAAEDQVRKLRALTSTIAATLQLI